MWIIALQNPGTSWSSSFASTDRAVVFLLALSLCLKTLALVQLQPFMIFRIICPLLHPETCSLGFFSLGACCCEALFVGTPSVYSFQLNIGIFKSLDKWLRALLNRNVLLSHSMDYLSLSMCIIKTGSLILDKNSGGSVSFFFFCVKWECWYFFADFLGLLWSLMPRKCFEHENCCDRITESFASEV